LPDKTHYDTLEVSPDATADEIKEAFRIMANAWHPDKFTPGSKYWARANEKMKAINEAYAVLKERQQRAEYDRLLGQDRKANESEGTSERRRHEEAETRRQAEAETRRRREEKERAAEQRRRREAEENRQGVEEEVKRVAPAGSGRVTYQSRPDLIGFAAAAGVVAVMVFIAVRSVPGPQTTNQTNSPAGGTNSTKIHPPTNAQRGDTWTNPRDGAKMVYIPAGEFIMGSNDSGRDQIDGGRDEKPQRRVYLDSYWLYQLEVTVAQYRKFCQATGTSMPSAPSWGFQDKHPIVNVSWNDAKAYCDWAGVELPTEAKWEMAARGTDGRKWPWGNEWDAKKCNTHENGPKTPTPVGAYPSGASPYNCLDMVGNVWEWCADWYDFNYYKNASQRNPTGPNTGQERVVRGGCWNSYSDVARCAFRAGRDPVNVYFNLGFRCAKTP